MIKMVAQPIVNVGTGDVIMEEMFCRPGVTINEYFDVSDTDLLWKRELHAILQGLSQKNGLPVNLNITLLSLPVLSKLNLSWSGGIEIVEWGKTPMSSAELSITVKKLQASGLSVWADDVTPADLNFWTVSGVCGYKVEMHLLHNKEFVKELLALNKPVIIERVETKEDEKKVIDSGFLLAQGYLYGKPV